MAVRSKSKVWGGSLARIAGSNPAEGMDVVSCVCVVLCWVGSGLCDELTIYSQESYRGCLWMICKPRKSGDLGPSWDVVPQKKSTNFYKWIRFSKGPYCDRMHGAGRLSTALSHCMHSTSSLTPAPASIIRCELQGLRTSYRYWTNARIGRHATPEVSQSGWPN